MRGMIVWRGKPTSLVLSYNDEEVVWCPKITIFGGLHVGFGRWSDSQVTQSCEGIFQAWRVMQLLQRVKRVRAKYTLGTVSSLVFALERKLDEEGWQLLAEDFGMSEDEFRELIEESEHFVPSPYELLDIWRKFNSFHRSSYLPELEEKLKDGSIESHPLVIKLAEDSRKVVDSFEETMRRVNDERRRKLEGEFIFAQDSSFFQFIGDIGFKELIAAFVPSPTRLKLDESHDYSHDKTLVGCLTKEGAPVSVALRSEVLGRSEYLSVQLSDGATGRIVAVRWDGLLQEFRVELLIDGRDQSDIMSIPTLRVACGMEEPGQRAPWLPPPPRPPLWKRLLSTLNLTF